ncbi:MAG: hypothetical protein JWN11_65 [Hyphomicrobiales bacterium]|nr:hypothetical protein [Hyphomicrobiales bacterium]
MRRATLIALSLTAALGLASYSPAALAAFRYTESPGYCRGDLPDPNQSLSSNDTSNSSVDRRHFENRCCVKRTAGTPLTALNADCPVGYVRVR